MTRIAVGGFLHETNTFAPTKATYDDFVHGGGWPAMAQGADVLKDDAQHQCRPGGLCRRRRKPRLGAGADHLVRRQPFGACHRGCVSSASSRSWSTASARPGRSMPSISICMARWSTEHLDDGEGEILARVREVIGNDLPLRGQPRPARQCHAGNGRACRRADRLSHLSARRHGRHRPRRCAVISRCCCGPGSALRKRSGNCRS